MQTVLFIVIDIALVAIAVFLSLNQRWLDQRRTLVLRSAAIWAAASVIVVMSGTLLLGPAPLALAIAGPCFVVALAAVASAAR